MSLDQWPYIFATTVTQDTTSYRISQETRMLIRRSQNVIDLPQASEITPRAVFESRRSFIRQLAVGSIATGSMLELASHQAFAQNSTAQKLAAKANPAFAVMDRATPYKD